MEIGGIQINWLGHSGFLIKNSKIIYIDPFQIKDDLPKADYIFLTHSHYDHCSREDIDKILQEKTIIIAPADCQSKVFRSENKVHFEIVEENQELDLNGIKVSVLPSYNMNKPFHFPGSGGVGYLIKINDVLIYHAGDTDFIPEMQRLTGYKQPGKNFIALLPISSKFTMSYEEAALAVKLIQPTLAIPMHYGSIAGTIEDANEFVRLCEEEGFHAKILEKL